MHGHEESGDNAVQQLIPSGFTAPNGEYVPFVVLAGRPDAPLGASMR